MERTHSDFTPSNYNPFEDPSVRFKHHSLMQDYQELHMKTEAMRKKIQTIRERKAILMAQVRFLRLRYRHLTQDQNVTDMKKVRGRSNGGKKSSKTQIQVEVSSISDVETKHVSIPDLNHSGKFNDETKTSLQRKVPLFDLNQISEEEEEETEAVKSSQEKMRVEESSSCKRMSSSNEMQQKEMKLSSCRNGGNGSKKKKISWQDPVAALRV